MFVVPRLRNFNLRWQTHKSRDLTWQLRIKCSNDDWNHQSAGYQLSPTSLHFIFTLKKHMCAKFWCIFFKTYLFFCLFWENNLTVWSSTYCYFFQEKYKPLYIYLPYIKILSVNIVLWRNSYQYSHWTNANFQWAEQWHEAAAQDIKGQRVSLNINNI